MQIPEEKLRVGLTHRSIETQRDKVLSPLTVEQARYARDAFAKAVYERMFTWLVERLNSSLENKVCKLACLGFGVFLYLHVSLIFLLMAFCCCIYIHTYIHGPTSCTLYVHVLLCLHFFQAKM